MCRVFLPVILSLISCTATADELSTVVVKRGTLPLVTDLEQRLNGTDALMQRPVEPNDKLFMRVMSRDFSSEISPSYPECVPGLEPLLAHPDLRVRYVVLKFLRDEIAGQHSRSSKLDPESATRLRRHCLALLDEAAHQKKPSMLCALAADLYVKLCGKQIPEDEDQALQSLLSSPEAFARRTAIDVLLKVPSGGPDDKLCLQIEKLLQSDSETDRQWIAHRLGACSVTTNPLRETIRRALARDPQMQGADRMALLLAKSGPIPKEAIPGLIAIICQPVPQVSRGMCCIPRSNATGMLTLDEHRLASRALKDISRTEITAVPLFVNLLEHPNAEVRRQGVNHLGHCGSLALSAMPKLLNMNKKRVDYRAASARQFYDSGVSFEIIKAVSRIALSSLFQLCPPGEHKILTGAAYVGLWVLE